MKIPKPNRDIFVKTWNNLKISFKKHKSIYIGTASVLSVAGLTMGIASQFLTQTIDYYVSNEHIKLKGKNSLFFVTDGGDIHDGSFNQAAYEEVTSIAGKYNYETPPNSNYSSLTHAYNLAVSRGASVLELNGFLHGQALKDFSHDNPKIGIIYLDSDLPIGTHKQQGNVASIIFETQQVGYLAGYAAAAWANQNHSKNKKPGNPIISGVGGLNIPPVTTYLAGFEQGMNKYNKDKSAKVQLYLKDVKKTTAKYFNGFEPDPQGQVTNYAKQAIRDNVDVIFPVGGPQAFTVIRTMKSEGVNPNTMKVIGVDQDLTKQSFAGLPKGGEWTKYILASATKSISNSIRSLSSSIFNTTIKGDTPGSETGNRIQKSVFGQIYNGSLKNNWMSITGQFINNKTQSSEELYKSLGLDLDAIKKLAAHAKSWTDFYGGKPKS